MINLTVDVQFCIRSGCKHALGSVLLLYLPVLTQGFMNAYDLD